MHKQKKKRAPFEAGMEKQKRDDMTCQRACHSQGPEPVSSTGYVARGLQSQKNGFHDPRNTDKGRRAGNDFLVS